MPKVKDFVFVKSPRGITAVREERKILRNKNRIVDDMDQSFPDGIFTDPTGNLPNIRFRDMDKYCKATGKKPAELTEKELDNFRIK